MWLVVVADVGTPFALGWYHATQRAGDYRFGTQNPLWAYAMVGTVMLLCATVLGIPDEPTGWQPAIAASVVAALIGAGIVATVLVFFPDLLPRFVLVTTPAVVAPINVAATMASIRLRHRRASNDRVFALLGADEAAFLLHETTQQFPRPEVAFQLAGMQEAGVRGATAANPERAASDHPGTDHPGTDLPGFDLPGFDLPGFDLPGFDLPGFDLPGFDLPGFDIGRFVAGVQASGATLLVVSDRLRDDEQVIAAAARLHESGVRVRTLEAFSDEWLGKLPVSALSRMALMTDIGEVHGGPYRQLKRLLDLAAGSVLLLVTALAVPVVMIGNAVANRGPLLFRQDRVGRNGAVFSILKFRTMTRSATVDTPWTRPDDPRITGFGRILRRSHLDELPQSWNILRGDLSIVGPRPEQPGYVADLRTKLPFYDMRHVVQPGLTGWAQVKYRYAATEADALEKLQYDLYYLRHQSLSLDVRILSRTARSVIRRRGR
jgi:lipopolysaccharide/colanic/teichoic acid biosynthesis glycosyltransferase